MRHIGKAALLFAMGGAVYIAVELLWRGHTNWTMAILGGVCFLLVGAINECFSWEMPLLLQGVIGAAVITAAELAAGIVLNIWLGLGIWDYSGMPLNLWGQICLPYSLLWVILAMAAVALDDWARYVWFGEEKPRYRLI